MQHRGHETFTVDMDSDFDPDLVADISTIDSMLIPSPIDILWASPPCTGFSVASIGANWTGGRGAYVPKSDTARHGIALVGKTWKLIDELNPTWWFVENPRGVLRKLPLMEGRGTRHTVSYCQYGDTRMKPTDVWTNATWWKPRPMCRNGSPCHQAAPRGSKTGTQGLRGSKERGVIPPQLFEEILEQIIVITQRA